MVSGCFWLAQAGGDLEVRGKVTSYLSLMKDKRDPGSRLDLSAAGRDGDRAGPGAFTLLGSSKGCVQ